MGDKRHEIPPLMLDAATAAMMALQGTDGGCIATQDLAEAALVAAGVAEMAVRIAGLEADSRRLRWLMTGSGIDGFYGVVDDRYDFASQIAYERGHDEPTPDDEFDGWRRLIDAAMNAPSGAGGE